MKGKNKIKYILWDLITNNDKIDKIYWQHMLWLTNDESIGVDRDGIFYVAKKRRRYWYEDDDLDDYIKYNGKNFFNSAIFKTLDYVAIIKRVNQFRLLYKTNLRANEVINCENQAIKRELIAKIGYKNLVKNLHSEVLDKNGTSELLKFELNTESIVLVKVIDPSTDDEYLLRVPPTMENCMDAIAWTFNLKTEEYNPVIET